MSTVSFEKLLTDIEAVIQAAQKEEDVEDRPKRRRRGGGNASRQLPAGVLLGES